MKLPRPFGSVMLLEELGQGAMGSVYLAETTGAQGFSLPVAVKIVDAGNIEQDKDLAPALADEARMLARVSHPNIVRVFGFDRVDDPVLGICWALVMEAVDGVDLSAVMQVAGGSLGIPAAVSVLSEMAEALLHAHNLQDASGMAMKVFMSSGAPQGIPIQSWTMTGSLITPSSTNCLANHRCPVSNASISICMPRSVIRCAISRNMPGVLVIT